MATMYETIMNLPLFKGLSHEQISAFLEKTNIQFSRYSDQDTIASASENVTELKCVISGTVKFIHKINASLTITEIEKTNIILGADKLFGMDTKYRYEAVAVGPVSTMVFSKQQYQNLLNAKSIFLLNYLNFLSYRAQIRYDIFSNYPGDSLPSICSRLIKAYCSRASEENTFMFDPKEFAIFCHKDKETLNREISHLAGEGILRAFAGGFTIIDKNLILDI